MVNNFPVLIKQLESLDQGRVTIVGTREAGKTIAISHILKQLMLSCESISLADALNQPARRSLYLTSSLKDAEFWKKLAEAQNVDATRSQVLYCADFSQAREKITDIYQTFKFNYVIFSERMYFDVDSPNENIAGKAWLLDFIKQLLGPHFLASFEEYFRHTETQNGQTTLPLSVYWGSDIVLLVEDKKIFTKKNRRGPREYVGRVE